MHVERIPKRTCREYCTCQQGFKLRWTTTGPYRNKRVSWLSQYHFLREPIRATYSDLSYFFSPADGIIVYQRSVHLDECIVEVKGRAYSLHDALRDPHYDCESLVIGIFMTFSMCTPTGMPYPGTISYAELDPLDTYSHPMLDEKGILRALRIPNDSLEYLHHNRRVLNGSTIGTNHS